MCERARQKKFFFQPPDRLGHRFLSFVSAELQSGGRSLPFFRERAREERKERKETRKRLEKKRKKIETDGGEKVKNPSVS